MVQQLVRRVGEVQGLVWFEQKRIGTREQRREHPEKTLGSDASRIFLNEGMRVAAGLMNFVFFFSQPSGSWKMVQPGKTPTPCREEDLPESKGSGNSSFF